MILVIPFPPSIWLVALTRRVGRHIYIYFSNECEPNSADCKKMEGEERDANKKVHFPRDVVWNGER